MFASTTTNARSALGEATRQRVVLERMPAAADLCHFLAQAEVGLALLMAKRSVTTGTPSNVGHSRGATISSATGNG